MNRPIKVMLIDDDPGIHESLRAVVEEAGYEFCGALGGREGLRLLDDEHPDLLLLDVMMPGMNGFDVCQQMREEGRRIPVIFLTAKNDIVDKSTGFKAGADDYVTKPFIADELLLRIDAHVRRHRGDIEHAEIVYRSSSPETAEVDENSITVFMRKIREKIENNPSEPRYLLTVWRVGYKLAAE